MGSLIKRLAGLAVVGIVAISAAAAQSVQVQASSDTLSVKEFGAVGDGKADDTTAFESAIAQAKAKGMNVHVPPGRYRLTRTITLGTQTLIGQAAGAWVADDNSLPMIIPEAQDGPCIRLLGGGSVHGLQFMYDWAGEDPSPRPATIELAGVGCRVSDLRIMGAWDAIMADGKNNVGRSLVQNCFIVNVHNIGVRMTGTWDVSWISKVEVWSPGSKHFTEKGVGFQLGKNDVLLLSDCLVFAGQTGYQLVDTIKGSPIKGGTWGSFTNCTADFCSFGIEVNGAHTVSFAGGCYWTHFGGMRVKGKGAQVRVAGLELAANGGPALNITGGDLVTVGACQIRREQEGFNVPAVSITGGKSVALTGCVISSGTTGIEISRAEKPNVALGNNIVREHVKPPSKPVTSP